MMSELRPTAIGVIGAGIMGEALISALITSGVQPSMITISEKREDRANELIAKYGVRSASLAENVSQAQALLLVVKPQDMGSLLDEIKKSLKPETLIVTFAAGKKISFIASHLDGAHPIIRVMPNTPALINEGMTVISTAQPATEDDLETVCEIFKSVGLIEVMQESYMNAVVAVSASSPAYVYMMIEAMADAAVLDGIPRETVYRLASQAVLGSAKMVLETGEHPAKLRDLVTSPGGITIQGIQILEQRAVRAALIDTVVRTTELSREMGKQHE